MFCRQLYVRARDGGNPSREGEQQATVTINVVRNRYTPIFSELHYTAEVRQDLGFGNRVGQVSATDQDPEVSLRWRPRRRHNSMA